MGLAIAPCYQISVAALRIWLQSFEFLQSFPAGTHKVMSKRGRVLAVRGRGGEGVEMVRQRVTVTKESPCVQGEGLEAVLEQERWEEEKRKEFEDQLVLAEVRGMKAIEKQEKARFLQERTEKDGLELKKSVRLVEDLRAANVVKQKKPLICNVQAIDDENKENQWRPFQQLGPVYRGGGGMDWDESPFHCCEVSRQKPSKETTTSTRVQNRPHAPLGAIPPATVLTSDRAVFRPTSPTRFPAHPQSVPLLRPNQEQSRIKPRNTDGQVQRTGLFEKEKKRGEEELEKLLGRLGSLDSTEEVSQLSTIMEKSESSSQDRDSVDLVPVRGPTPAEDSAASSISPFPSSRIVSSRRENNAGLVKEEKAPSLDSVAALVSRIKRQREALESQEKPVAPPAGQVLLPTIKRGSQPVPQQYKLNTDFIKKVLEFSRSSDLASSSSGSVSEAQVRVNIVLPGSSSSTFSEPSPILKPQQMNRVIPSKANPRSNDRHSKKKPPQKQLEGDAEAEKQKKLRFYIEKLLKMKHEEVENLSSSSTNDSRKQVCVNGFVTVDIVGIYDSC